MPQLAMQEAPVARQQYRSTLKATCLQPAAAVAPLQGLGVLEAGKTARSSLNADELSPL